MYDTQLEITLASILFHKQELLGYDIIDKDDFYTDIKTYVNKMIKLYNNGSVIDSITIGRDFEKPDINDIDRFDDLIYALKTLNKERKLQDLPKQITNIVLDKYDYETKLIKLREKLDSLENTTSDIEEFSVKNLISEYRELLKNKECTDILKTGINSLDGIIGDGFRKGELISIAGESGGFKSTLMYNIALNIALRGEKVLIFSYEVNRNEINEIFVSILTRINSIKLKTRLIKDGEMEKIEDALATIESLDNLYIFDNNSRLTDIKLIGLQTKPALILIDYLQIMPDISKDTVQSLEYVTRQLKIMTGNSMINCPIILLSQFSRAEKSEDGGRKKTRTIQDLKGSSGIEQNSNIVIFTEATTDSEDWKDTVKENIIIHVKKNRNGPKNKILVPIDRTTHWIDPIYIMK